MNIGSILKFVGSKEAMYFRIEQPQTLVVYEKKDYPVFRPYQTERDLVSDLKNNENKG
jgi:hypothetical protein